MKIILLLVAVYALIINQALKQADSKPVIQAKKDRHVDQTGNDLYLNTALRENDRGMERQIKRISIEKQNDFTPNFLFQRETEQDYLKPQILLFPINCPYPANLEKRRS